MRIYPEKNDCLILDYAPKEARQIVMLGDVLGTEIRKDAYVKDDGDEGDVIGGFTFDGDFRWMEGSAAEIVTRQLDYLDMTSWRWHRGADGWLTLGMGKGSDEIQRTAAISPPGDDDEMRLYAVWKNGSGCWQAKLAEAGEFDDLSMTAEGWADKHAEPVLAEKAKRWQKQKPTDPQTAFAKRLGAWREGMNRGECAAEITHRLARKAIG